MNFTGIKSTIAGTGYYLPEKIITSQYLEEKLSLEAGWIEKRTGVSARRFAADDQAVSDLAYQAAKSAMSDAEIKGSDIGLVLLATSSPDHLLPPTAALLAHKIGSNGGAMDIAAACTGFIYALSLADSFVRIHGINVIIIGANILSRRINFKDKTSSIIFGDGAGAVILKPTIKQNTGLIGVYLSSKGQNYDLIKIPMGGSRQQFNPDANHDDYKIKISNGAAAFTAAVESMIETANITLKNNDMTIDQIDWWIPHQANIRIIKAAAKKIGIDYRHIAITIKDYGNSSAATIPLTLAKYRQDGIIKDGDKLLLTGVGAGFTEGSLIYQF